MAGWADARVGDRDRETAAELLREHYAAGRLTLAEFQDRLQAAYAATTYRELAAVTADLPAAAPGMAGPGIIDPGAAASAVRQLRAMARRVLLTAAAGIAGVVALCVLAAVFLPHGGVLAVLLAVLLAPVLLAGIAVAALAWIARRAWRSGAWLDAVPAAAGMPWLGRVMRVARALLAGRAVWRAGRRAARPLRARRATASYQAQPGGTWQHAPVRDAGWAPR
jgi:hypothetical protein